MREKRWRAATGDESERCAPHKSREIAQAEPTKNNLVRLCVRNGSAYSVLPVAARHLCGKQNIARLCVRNDSASPRLRVKQTLARLCVRNGSASSYCPWRLATRVLIAAVMAKSGKSLSFSFCQRKSFFASIFRQN